MKRYLNQIYFGKPASYRSRIIGIILLTIGLIFFYYPTPLNMKIGVTTLILGFFLLFMMTGKTTTKGIGDVQLTLILVTWVILMFFFTGLGNTDLQIFFILVFIGLLVIKEITRDFTPDHLKNRIKIFTVAYLMIFILIVAIKIINFLGI